MIGFGHFFIIVLLIKGFVNGLYHYTGYGGKGFFIFEKFFTKPVDKVILGNSFDAK
jgi:hypothetical protein